MSSLSSVRAPAVIAASVGVVAASCIAYALYFDHRRRTDPDFRRSLKREAKKIQKAQKAQAEASAAGRVKDIRKAVEEIANEPVPTSPEEIEATFLNELSTGEKLSTDDSQQLESAKAFYRALKVYPSKSELISLYERTVPKVNLS
jgi:import receptor subunit TOM20